METNEKIEQKRIILDSPGERRKVITETTRAGPSEFNLSPGTIGLIAVLAIIVIGIVIYVVSNKNANEAANRETISQSSREQMPPPMVQQPAAPIIVQQPVPAQQVPVIIQQPLQPSAGMIIDDATMNEVATKRLADDPGMASVSVTIREGRAVLTGTVNSVAIKASAEQLIRDVRGVKSVDNQIVLSTQ